MRGVLVLVLAVHELLGSLLGRLLICANQIDPQLNVPILTYDVGAILLHLLTPQQRP